MPSYEIREVTTIREQSICAALRTIVYIIEQECPILIDFDKFEKDRKNYLLWDNGEPVASASYRIIDNGTTGKIERIVVLKEARGKGFGKAITAYIRDHLKDMLDIKEIIISSQDHAIPLYQKLGFEIVGEGYMDAGIAHHKMILSTVGKA